MHSSRSFPVTTVSRSSGYWPTSRAAAGWARLCSSASSAASRFLSVELDYVGEIPEDAFLRRSIREQRPVVTAYPSSPAGIALKTLALRADMWPVAEGPRGNVEFFVERLIRRPSVCLEVVR